MCIRDSRSALISLGYVSREAGHDQDAEKYFLKLESAYPTLYIPYLALGDMYAARKDFIKADASYKKGYELAPANALIVAGAVSYTHLDVYKRQEFAGH